MKLVVFIKTERTSAAHRDHLLSDVSSAETEKFFKFAAFFVSSFEFAGQASCLFFFAYAI